MHVQLADNLRLRQCRHGLMVCLTTDHYIGKALDLYGEFSEGEVAAFRQLIKPEHVVLDIGANHGSHTVFFAKHARFVHAFEPQPFMHRILCTNITLNGLMNVRTYQAGVGAKANTLMMPAFDYTKPGNFGASPLKPIGDGDRVPVINLASLGLHRCDFIKIDAEGMEQQVLEGGQNLIQQFHPIIYLENDRPEKSESLMRYLIDLGYFLYWHLPLYYSPYNFYGNTENIYPRQISINMLAVPRDGPKPGLISLIPVANVLDTWKAALARHNKPPQTFLESKGIK